MISIYYILKMATYAAGTIYFIINNSFFKRFDFTQEMLNKLDWDSKDIKSQLSALRSNIDKLILEIDSIKSGSKSNKKRISDSRVKKSN